MSSFLLGNVCFSKNLYDEVGGYDESVGMAEDLDLYVRFLIHGHLNVYLPIISHLHRMHTANFSIGCDRDKHHSDLKDIYGRNEEKLKVMGCYSYEKSIPECYKLSSIDNRKKLLKGLMDGDGSVSKTAQHLEYSTSSDSENGKLCSKIGFCRCGDNKLI